MTPKRRDELKAMLDFAHKQSRTNVQLQAPDGTSTKNEFQIIADVVSELLDAVAGPVTIPAGGSQATVLKATEAKDSATKDAGK